MNWIVGDRTGGDPLVRVGTTAAAAADGSAFVGTWGRVEGANKEGLTERWEIKRIKGEWSVKRTYANKAGKVVGFSLYENPVFADGTLRYIERLKQKPNSSYAEVCTRTLKFEPDGSSRIEATWTVDGRGGKETLVRTTSK
jgi:hypothetical protein